MIESRAGTAKRLLLGLGIFGLTLLASRAGELELELESKLKALEQRERATVLVLPEKEEVRVFPEGYQIIEPVHGTDGEGNEVGNRYWWMRKLGEETWRLYDLDAGEFRGEPWRNHQPGVSLGRICVANVETGGWGLLGLDGAVVLKAAFQRIEPFGTAERLAPVFDGKRAWFVDPAGQRVGVGEYQDARPFSFGLAAVKRDGKWGYVNTEQAWIVEPRFDEADAFRASGFAKVRKGGRWFAIDKSGRITTPAGYAALFLEDSDAGQVKVRARAVSGKMGLVDLSTGAEPGGFVWEQIGLPGEKSAFVLAHEGEGEAAQPLVGLIGLDGRVWVKPGTTWAYDAMAAGTESLGLPWFSSEGVACVLLANKAYGFVNAEGKETVGTGFYDVSQEVGSNGVAVRYPKKGRNTQGWKWLDRKGKVVLDNAERLVPMSGLIWVYGTDGATPWMLFDTQGHRLGAGQWRTVYPFQGEHALVATEGHTALLDAKGREIARLGAHWKPSRPLDLNLSHLYSYQVSTFGAWQRSKLPLLLTWTAKPSVLGMVFEEGKDPAPVSLPIGSEPLGSIEDRPGLYCFGDELMTKSGQLQIRGVLDWPARKVILDGKSLGVNHVGSAWPIVKDARFKPVALLGEDPAKRLIPLPEGFEEAEQRGFPKLLVWRGGEKWGMLAADGRELSPPVWDEIEIRSSEDAVLRVRRGAKWGAISALGRPVLAPEWDDLLIGTSAVGVMQRQEGKPPTSPTLPTSPKPQWGLASLEGKLLLPPRFDELAPAGSRWLVRVGERWGIVGSDGKEIAAPQWQELVVAGPNRFFARSGDTWGLLDERGRALAQGWEAHPVFHGREEDSAHPGEECIEFKQGGSAGLATPDGKTITPGGCSKVWPVVSASLAVFEQNGKSGLITLPEGKILQPALWSQIVPGVYWSGEDGFIRMERDGKAGLLNEKGAIVVAPEWDDVRTLSADAFSVQRAEKWGVVDAHGRVVEEPEYDDILLEQGIFLFRKGDQWTSKIGETRYPWVVRSTWLSAMVLGGKPHFFTNAGKSSDGAFHLVDGKGAVVTTIPGAEVRGSIFLLNRDTRKIEKEIPLLSVETPSANPLGGYPEMRMTALKPEGKRLFPLDYWGEARKMDGESIVVIGSAEPLFVGGW